MEIPGDRAVMDWLYGLELELLPVLTLTHLSTRGGIWVLAGLGMTIFGRDRNRRTGMALLSGLLAHVLLLELTIKHLVARERPWSALGLELRDPVVNPESYSFPSGHTAASFMGAWILGCRFPRWRWPMLFAAALVGASRVHLGAHYPTDVLVGTALGLAIGAVFVRVYGVAPPEPVAAPA